MAELSLPELDADYLKALKIKVIGDVLAIVRWAKTVSTKEKESTSTENTGATAATHTFKPPPESSTIPHIQSEMTHPQFRKFRTDWRVYKEITHLPADKVGVYLNNICE